MQQIYGKKFKMKEIDGVKFLYTDLHNSTLGVGHFKNLLIKLSQILLKVQV